MTTKIDWETVPMAAQGCNDKAYSIPEGPNAQRIKYLMEYRQTHGINGVWLCEPDELDARDDCSMLGPEVDDIDWSGFPVNLTAAAPELLEALEFISADHDERYKNDMAALSTMLQACRDTARAAIAKATT